jgi:hypothetical protein
MRMQQSERRFHRKTAAQCFNKTWDYLDKKKRTADHDAIMLHSAHASRYHWSLVGSPGNLAVGDWQISRVYAALDQPSLSLRFAKSSLEIARKNKLPEILVTAYEAMARAHAVAKNFTAARNHLGKALTQLDSLTIEDGDREIYLDQIRETERMIRR